MDADAIVQAKRAIDAGDLDAFVAFTVNDVELRQSTVWSWLHLASEDGHLEIVKYLVENGANVNSRDSGRAAIHGAVSYGHFEIAR